MKRVNTGIVVTELLVDADLEQSKLLKAGEAYLWGVYSDGRGVVARSTGAGLLASELVSGPLTEYYRLVEELHRNLKESTIEDLADFLEDLVEQVGNLAEEFDAPIEQELLFWEGQVQLVKEQVNASPTDAVAIAYLGYELLRNAPQL